ncbi:MAG: polyprenyl synthetase family protein [Dehalococcoidia bacterium]|nr:polyprenyl synthetase family protein [Dehalococcoidia bacterium]
MVPTLDDLYGAVKGDLLALLRDSRLSEPFLQIVEKALVGAGKVLSSNPRSRWPLLVLLPCWAAGGNWRNALPVATAAELVGVATELFDDVEDGDDSTLVDSIGAPRTVNLASALLAFAGRSLCRSSALVGDRIWQALVTAADGQDSDLGEGLPTTPDEYLAIVDRKSAGLTAALCWAGARLSGATSPVLDGYERFGLYVGRWGQLVNDSHDVWPGVTGKSDLQRRLSTLPLIFLLRSPENPESGHLREYLAGDDPLLPGEEATLREALWASGALHYTWLVAEASRDAAESALREVCPATEASVLLGHLLSPRPPAG